MTTGEIVLSILLFLIWLTSCIYSKIQESIIKAQEKNIEKLQNDNSGLLEFCLTQIIKIAIENEDYEQAARASNSLKELLSIKQ